MRQTRGVQFTLLHTNRGGGVRAKKTATSILKKKKTQREEGGGKKEREVYGAGTGNPGGTRTTWGCLDTTQPGVHEPAGGR